MIIWIIGPLSSGKTTQNKLLLKKWGDGPKEYHEGEENGVMFSFTRYGNIASLGLMNESQCCGLDRVSSKLKNEGIKLSLKKALELSEMVVVESIMSASTWFDILKATKEDIFIFSLELSFEENVRRLKWRKSESDGKYNCQTYLEGENRLSWDDQAWLNTKLSDANYEFIRKTRNQYANIFKKFIDKAKGSVIQCDDKSPNEINKEIRNYIVKNV